MCHGFSNRPCVATNGTNKLSLLLQVTLPTDHLCTLFLTACRLFGLLLGSPDFLLIVIPPGRPRFLRQKMRRLLTNLTHCFETLLMQLLNNGKQRQNRAPALKIPVLEMQSYTTLRVAK